MNYLLPFKFLENVMTQSTKTAVTFIGIGAMGAPMAQQLIKAGFDVTVYNRSVEKCAALQAAGARVESTLSDAVTAGGIVITMVSNDAVLNDLMIAQGVAAKLGSGLHISMSSIAPETARALAMVQASHGGMYLAAPVFGRPAAAAEAKLWITQSGPAAAKAIAQPLLAAMGQSITDFGDDAGAANLIKLCGNFMILSAVEAMSEAMALAEKNGLDRNAMSTFFGQTIFSCPIYQNYGRILANRAFTPPGFQLALGMKDVKLLQGSAEDAGVPMPLANLLHERMVGSIAKGRGELDWTAIELIVAEAAALKVE
jgi:3-hydroxyisobutyrate dehydrogenase-like beta-hydroxyacid dehydrogenase